MAKLFISQKVTSIQCQIVLRFQKVISVMVLHSSSIMYGIVMRIWNRDGLLEGWQSKGNSEMLISRFWVVLWQPGDRT